MSSRPAAASVTPLRIAPSVPALVTEAVALLASFRTERRLLVSFAAPRVIVPVPVDSTVIPLVALPMKIKPRVYVANVPVPVNEILPLPVLNKLPTVVEPPQ